MTSPKWAPPELIELRKEILSKLAEEGEDDTSLAPDQNLLLGCTCVGWREKLEIVNTLITAPDMASVWKSLKRQEKQFKGNLFASLGGPKSHYSKTLYGVCVHALESWPGVPKVTGSEMRKLHEEIAGKAAELTELLSQTNVRNLLDTRAYISVECVERFAAALEIAT